MEIKIKLGSTSHVAFAFRRWILAGKATAPRSCQRVGLFRLMGGGKRVGCV